MSHVKGVTGYATGRQHALLTEMSRVPKMDEIEVLAHITAPSGFQDDVRYRAQAAAAAAEFEPFERIRVYSPEDRREEPQGDIQSPLCDDEESTFHTSFSFSAWYQTPQVDVIKETPAQKLTRELLSHDQRHRITDSLTRRESQGGRHTKDSTRSITWKITKSQARDQNSPFKIPSFNSKLAASTVHAARTPETPRPKTAPAGSTAHEPTYQCKRARSEFLSFESFESLLSVIPDSQEKPESAVARASLHPVASSAATNNSTPHSTAQTIVPEQPLGLQARPIKRQRPNPTTNTSQQSGTPDVAQVLGRFPCPLCRAQRNRRALRNSIEKATTSCLDSTSMWPPNPRTDIYYPPSPERGHSAHAQTTACQHGPTLTSQSQPVDGWFFSQSSSPAAPNMPASRDTFSQLFPSISSLPTAVHGPTPPIGHASYATHLTPSLGTLATRLRLVTSFRPILVARDIIVLERGYWHLRIPVMLHPSSQQPDGSASGSKDSSWTEETFIHFWHAVVSYLQSGWAGWGVSMYLQGPTGPDSPSTCPPGQNDEETNKKGMGYIVVKVTCWGEIIPHIYLLLWVMSDKRLAGLGMEWRDAREEVVIRMSGEREEEGKLGEYGFKGGEGVDGRWGIIRAQS